MIAIDTPLDPTDAADATFATDNFKAGRLIGSWATRAQLGDQATDAKIAYLDLLPSQPRQDVARDQGFMTGFGIDVGDVNRIGDETDPRNVCHDTTNGNPEGGRRAMENCLQVDPGINVTINEPSAAGAYEALKALGRENDVMILSVDGGCPGVENVAEGVIGATAQQRAVVRRMAQDRARTAGQCRHSDFRHDLTAPMLPGCCGNACHRSPD